MEPLPFLVRPAGVEPAASGLEVPCSIQLSYGRVESANSVLCAAFKSR